ncbi:MAG TPA: FHA domain-containing protein [Pirellulales bacterium]|nr:FHA domain-containing protein [Pirellulales bacterium]
MEAKLVVVGGKANKSEVKLKLPAMIGRSRDADVTVSHASVSRHHCLIFELDGALVVRDNGSLNGTVIDGERIKESLLKPGQSLTIGPLTFRADYEHAGEFPVLGAAPSNAVAANGEAVDNDLPFAASTSKADDEPSKADEEDDTVQAPAAAVEAALSAAPADEEASPATADNDGFDFLDEEASDSTGSVASSAPSFSFLKDSSADAEPDEDDSAAVFRLADDSAPAPAPQKSPPAPAEKAPAAKGAANKAAAKGDDEAALDDFLNSLGLEE